MKNYKENRMLITYKLFSCYPKFLASYSFSFLLKNSIIDKVIHISTSIITNNTK